jgi:hypothetical protein
MGLGVHGGETGGIASGAKSKCADGSHAGHTVGDRVVQLHEHPDPALGQARDEPHPPQRSGSIQRPATKLLTRTKELRLVVGGFPRERLDVVGEVDGRDIHPQRPAKATTGHVQALAESREEVQPVPDLVPDAFDPKPPLPIQQARPLEDGQRADVLGPPEFLRPHHAEISCGQPVHTQAGTSSLDPMIDGQDLRSLHWRLALHTSVEPCRSA